MKIRILLNKKGNIWSARSLDLGLSAQGYSYREAKNKLDSQIDEYIEEAKTLDAKDKKIMLSRKGPIGWFVTFYFRRWRNKFFTRWR